MERYAAELSAALTARDAAKAEQAFGMFQALVCEHLRVEEELVFPLAEKVLADSTDPIRSLRIAHISYRRDLEQIGTQISSNHLNAAHTLYLAFMDSFETHERLEEQLLELLKSKR